MRLVCITTFMLLLAWGAMSDEGTEYVAVVKIKSDHDVMNLVRSGISLDHPNKQAQTFEAYVTEKEIPILSELGLEYSISENNKELRLARSVEVVDDSAPAYHNYDALTTFMNDISTRYPDITRLFSVGKSVQNREIWGIEISDNVGENEIEPEFKYAANMHGDEVVGREMAINFIELLCTSYGTDPRITRLINNTHIFIIPSVNPDGFERRTRGNAHGVDLNRNFPDQFSSPSNTPDGREPEVAAMMAFIQSHHFTLSANFHGGAVVANYPYDGNSNYRSGQYTPTPDDAVFKELAMAYSLTHKTMHNSQEFTNGITNGADWYVLYGGMQDYHYVYNDGAMEITIELSDNKWPPASELPHFWDQNKEAMLVYMELVHQMGVRGTVTNSDGTPLDAEIKVSSIAKSVRTDPENGDYYRLLTAGTYSMSASAQGYKTATTIVQIPPGQSEQVVVHFTLNHL